MGGGVNCLSGCLGSLSNFLSSTSGCQNNLSVFLDNMSDFLQLSGYLYDLFEYVDSLSICQNYRLGCSDCQSGS